jgi:caffeoyl-CoA O-methyltransferase
MDMTPERWTATSRYIREVFCREDKHLASLMERATAAGLPDIDVGADSGRLLSLLARVTGARLAVEVGTLGGYSAIWLARGLLPGGRLISIDINPDHLEFAQRELVQAGVADRVELRRGKGKEQLAALLAELGAGTVDLILLDAERSEYVPALPTVRGLLRRGGVLLIDNALNAGRWVPDPIEPGAAPDQMDLVNRTLAGAEGFESTLLPVGNGMAFAVRT